jgi:D-beta-D-heptose 7-phosphate kinase/D-beta-D-heptose 1-phosphate adenosyltransferase
VGENLLTALARFEGAVALVLGDVMLDRYWWGSVTRISPEAPVPIVRVDQSSAAPGGAANVAANIASLGATPWLVGLVGDDDGGPALHEALKRLGVGTEHLLTAPGRATTVKTRIVAHQQQVVRVDHEVTAPVSDAQAGTVAAKVKTLLPEAAVMVISDYAKGLLTPALLTEVIGEARRLGKPVVIDPKGKDYRRYKGATLLTPNRVEAYHASGLELGAESIPAVGAQLLNELEIDALLITLGEDGMSLFQRDSPSLQLDAAARAVYDVTGAGDTVIATLSLAIGVGADLPTGAQLANIAAGLAVEQVGTAAISLEQLRRAVNEVE